MAKKAAEPEVETHIIKVKVTKEERAAIRVAAAPHDESLSAYIKRVALADAQKHKR